MAPTKTTTRKRPSTKARPKTASTKTRTGTRTGTRSSVVKKGKGSTTATKSTRAKAVADKPEPSSREFDVHGFVVGSDSSIIAQTLVEGGEDRNDINAKIAEKIEKTNGLETRGGGEKNVSSLVSGILARLREQGYEVESSWTLDPPTEVSAAMKKEAATAKRKATRASKR